MIAWTKGRRLAGSASAERRRVAGAAPAERRRVAGAAPAEQRQVTAGAPSRRRAAEAALAEPRRVAGAAPAGIRTDKVKLCGSVPTQADIAALKAGESGAWTAFASPVMGWRVMDIFARHFGGDSLDPVNASPLLPTQLLTKQNINSIVTDPSAMDWYVGVTNYAGQFKRLWHLS